MGLAKSPRLRGRRGCPIAYGIGHAGSLIIAIRLEIEGNGRQACSLAGRVVEAPRVDFPARHSMLAVIFESPTIRCPKKSFATWWPSRVCPRRSRRVLVPPNQTGQRRDAPR